MDRKKIESSNIESIGYENELLEIEFKLNPFLYIYKNVPKDVYLNLMLSDSVGKAFYKYIKDKYEFDKKLLKPK